MSQTVKTKLTQGGRIVIPAEMRKKLGMEIGDNLNIELHGEALQVTTSRSALRRIQNQLRQNVPPEVSLVDQLIADRRKEVDSE